MSVERESVRYTREQQIEDLECIDITIALLSARVVGEKQNMCEAFLLDYVRISRYFATNKPRVSGLSQQLVGRMFHRLTSLQAINGFECRHYEQMLKQVRKHVRNMLFLRRKKAATCLAPEIHIQKCYCANAARAKALEEPDVALLSAKELIIRELRA